MRPDFLVHWTGKDISLKTAELTDAHRTEYVDRLHDILSRGFWMTKPVEKIKGTKESWIEYKAPMTCFTEIRLSQARFHAEQYGLLGVGVTRRFVLDRFGGPVHYVRNHEIECVIGNAQEVHNALKRLNEPEVVNYFAVNSAFIKSMSHLDTDDFFYLEEQEWRIVHTHLQTEAGNLVKTDVPPPEYRVLVRVDEVSILVFPDEQTRKQARNDPRLTAWLSPPSPLNAILLTLKECEQF